MDEDEDEEFFPADDVAASAADGELQATHPLSRLDSEERENLDYLRTRALIEGASGTSRWIYFRSPEWTWMAECGREGWLLYEPKTKRQFAFVMPLMN